MAKRKKVVPTVKVDEQKERLELADLHLDITHCVGEHLVVRGYGCKRCGSTDPWTMCMKEKVFRNADAKEVYSHFTDTEKSKQYAKFTVLEKEKGNE